MLTKLVPLPMVTLSKIRHMRIIAENLRFRLGFGRSRWYHTVHFLKLLPGLRLDTLTVIGTYDGKRNYHILNMFIRHGQGWKELRYISPSQLLGFPLTYRIIQEGVNITDRYQRKPQPADWNDAMNSRDGATSQPSVAMYRSNTWYGDNCIKATRVKYEQEPPGPGEEDEFSKQRYGNLMLFNERYKELRVVVRRGRGIDYQEKLGSPFLAIDDIRQDFPGMTWAEIKRQYIDSDRQYGSKYDNFGDEKRDIYKHTDDYVEY
ncbi:hypothetical protein F4679DRAFT_585461 [Xylaria curta]|nr:hypothetical protein F4679DRAFT_585461 [Xylaria curta]